MEENYQCKACDESFTNADELKSHQIGPCSAIEVTTSEVSDVKDDTSPNPIDVATPDLPSVLEETPEIPEPVDTDTPVLRSRQNNIKTPELTEEALPEVEINTTQDIINHIAGNGVSALKPSESPELPGSDVDKTSSPPTPADPFSKEAVRAADVQNIIAGYCVDAPCEKVRDILRLYSPGNSYAKQKTIFNNRSNKADMVKTLQFLGESHSSWKEVKKIDCAHKLHYRIQNLMPEECGVCKETYVVSKSDTSLLACSICGHEVHHKCYQSLLEKNEEGLSIVEALKKMPGFHHLCPSCEDDIIPDDKLTTSVDSEDPPPASPPFSQQPQQHPLQLQKQQQQQKQQPQQPPQQQKQPPQQQQQHKESGNPNSHESIDRSETKNSSSLSPNEGEEDLSKDDKECKKTPVCRHYKNNTCRFGMKGKGCEFEHPKRCTKLMNYGTKTGKGCNLGKNCTSFHPKMCPMSISNGECYDTHCNLCHVKGTKRKRPPAKEKAAENNASRNLAFQKGPVKDSPKEETIRAENEELKSFQQSFLERISLLKVEIQEAVDAKISALLNPATQNHLKQENIPQPRPPAAVQQYHLAAPAPRLNQQTQFQLMTHPPAVQHIPTYATYPHQTYYQAPVPQVPLSAY